MPCPSYCRPRIVKVLSLLIKRGRLGSVPTFHLFQIQFQGRVIFWGLGLIYRHMCYRPRSLANLTTLILSHTLYK